MSGKESDIRDDDIFMHSVGLTLLVSIDGHFPEPYTVERATIEVPRFLMLYEKKISSGHVLSVCQFIFAFKKYFHFVMVKTDLFKRYLWLVELIYRNDGITREEINRQWSRSHLNGGHECELPERTFHRHKLAIKDLFEIEIVCDRHGEKTYHILNRDEIDNDEMKTCLLNNFAFNSLLLENRDLKHRIVFESNPSGNKFLTTIMEVMRDNAVISLNYQSFHMTDAARHVMEPYCLKIYSGVVFVDGYFHMGTVARQGFVDGVIDHFIHQMVQTSHIDIAYIHGRAFAHRFQAFQHLDILRGICPLVHFRTFHSVVFQLTHL